MTSQGNEDIPCVNYIIPDVLQHISLYLNAKDYISFTTSCSKMYNVSKELLSMRPDNTIIKDRYYTISLSNLHLIARESTNATKIAMFRVHITKLEDIDVLYQYKDIYSKLKIIFDIRHPEYDSDGVVRINDDIIVLGNRSAQKKGLMRELNRRVKKLKGIYSLQIKKDALHSKALYRIDGLNEIKVNKASQLTNCNPFKNMSKVELINCTNITDVSMLGNVHTLILSGCINIVNVSALGRVHNLCLSDCVSVRDVSMLGNVCILNLNNTYVSDVSALGNVRVLNISRTPVSDVSMLGRVFILDISYTLVRDVRALGNVSILRLSNTLVEDVSALANVKSLDVSNTLVRDVSMLTRVRTLYIKNCPNITDTSMLNNRLLIK